MHVFVMILYFMFWDQLCPKQFGASPKPDLLFFVKDYCSVQHNSSELDSAFSNRNNCS